MKRIVFYADFHPDNRGSTPLGDVEDALGGVEPKRSLEDAKA